MLRYHFFVQLRSSLLTGTILFACIWGFFLVITLRTPLADTFSSDAQGYSQGAIHLLQDFHYTIDGIHPSIDREPGQSIFLAIIYALFGIENRIAVFAVQGLLFLAAAMLLCWELRRRTSDQTAGTCFLLLVLFPATFHIIFSANRESLALTLALFFTTMFLRYERSRNLLDASIAGVLLGLLILTYMPFLFLPLFLAPFALILWRVKPAHLGAFIVIPYLFVAGWGIRNVLVSGHSCLSGCQRPAAVWYVRGEQAEKLRELEPLRCLWSEYISRDWMGRSDACSFNALKNRKWPEGFKPEELSQDLAIAREGQQKILRNFGSYLWFSLVDILELHLPFVNGWGRIYNIAAALGTVILYAGCILGIRRMLRYKDLWIIVAIPLYATAVFVLTDATPRYLMPVIFVYAMVAAMGYEKMMKGFSSSPSRREGERGRG